LRDNLPLLGEFNAAFIGRLFFWAGISRAEVFNMFVENLVEKEESVSVTGSLCDALAVCTRAGAGTFVLQLADRILL